MWRGDSVEMAQVLQKEYECFNCHAMIKVSKIDNTTPGGKKWLQFEADGVTPHTCSGKKQAQPNNQQTLNPPPSAPKPQAPTAVPAALTAVEQTITKLEAKMDTLLAEIRIVRMVVEEMKKKQ